MVSKRSLAATLVALALAVVLFSGFTPSAHAAPQAPAHPAVAQTCTGDTIVRDQGTDFNIGGDLVWVEAQVRADSCNDLRQVAIFEVDAGCGIFGYCNSGYQGTGMLLVGNTGLEARGPIELPEDGNYHGYGNTGITNWPARGNCYWASAWVNLGTDTYQVSTDGYCI